MIEEWNKQRAQNIQKFYQQAKDRIRLDTASHSIHIDEVSHLSDIYLRPGEFNLLLEIIAEASGETAVKKIFEKTGEGWEKKIERHQDLVSLHEKVLLLAQELGLALAGNLVGHC